MEIDIPPPAKMDLAAIEEHVRLIEFVNGLQWPDGMRGSIDVSGTDYVRYLSADECS